MQQAPPYRFYIKTLAKDEQLLFYVNDFATLYIRITHFNIMH